MKRLVIFIVLVFMLGTMAGCGQVNQSTKKVADQYPKKIVIQAPLAPPTAPLLQMVQKKPFGDKSSVQLIIYKTVEEATARILNGEADFTVLPLNTAAKLYNKKADISLANVTTWGILYLLSSDSSVSGWHQLKGKEVYVGAQGASPDIITRYLLEKNQISPGDVSLKYADSPEIAQMMIQGIAHTAVLPEPLVTNVISKNPKIKVVMDFQKEWQKLESNKYGLPQAGMVVQNKFLRDYPAAVAVLQKAYAQALVQTVDNPASVAGLVQQKFNIPASVFEQSMKRTNIKFVYARDAKADVDNYLSKLLQLSPDIVGGKLPDEKFYLSK